MKGKSFKVPIYNYTITFVEIESTKDTKKLKKIFKLEDVKKKDAKHIFYNVENNYFNGGEMLWNKNKRSVIIIIYKVQSESIRLNVLGHEKRHAEDMILEHLNVDDIESAALLAGFLTTNLFK